MAPYPLLSTAAKQWTGPRYNSTSMALTEHALQQTAGQTTTPPFQSRNLPAPPQRQPLQYGRAHHILTIFMQGLRFARLWLPCWLEGEGRGNRGRGNRGQGNHSHQSRRNAPEACPRLLDSLSSRRRASTIGTCCPSSCFPCVEGLARAREKVPRDAG
jgi:hypothetical protein